MKLAKCLLVALALWMPAASFAVAAGYSASVEQGEPCEEASSHDESSEQNELFLPAAVALLAPKDKLAFDHVGHRPLDGHVDELLIPPPNPAAL